ncbi:MAG TPA: glycosyltransferase [Candidatus Didemnitutus sp.]|nr:glycosyltransferase [Candidatus Didemnitutus sp.]
MPRILVVSPHFPPVNAPDMQRIRMSLPHFVDAGWEVVVLAANDREPLAPLEPDLLQTVPAAVRVVRTHVWSRRWTHWFGLNNLGLRTLLSTYWAGRKVLRESSFDLVYFSSTQAVLFPLGRLWRSEFQVPYVIDLQDPWLSDYYHRPGAPRPPGGWKYAFAHGTARMFEGWTLARAAHVISVSQPYLDALEHRYPWFRRDSGSVLTFGSPDADFAVARERYLREPPITPATRGIKIAYAGRLGPDMLPALDHLFHGIALVLREGIAIEVYFYGTSYAPAGQAEATTTSLAASHGIAAHVHEFPARITYLNSLRLLLETDVALVLGSNDPSYSPSKLYPTLLAGKPTLAVAPERTVLAERIAELGGAVLAAYAPGSGTDPLCGEKIAGLLRTLVRDRASFPAPPANLERIREHYSAAAVAVRQLEVFLAVIARHRHPPATLPEADQQAATNAPLPP